MNKTKTPEPQTVTLETPKPSATTKRYDDAFKRAAVENWIKSGQRGTQIAAELAASAIPASKIGSAAMWAMPPRFAPIWPPKTAR
jgi:hypothetical protein